MNVHSTPENPDVTYSPLYSFLPGIMKKLRMARTVCKHGVAYVPGILLIMGEDCILKVSGPEPPIHSVADLDQIRICVY